MKRILSRTSLNSILLLMICVPLVVFGQNDDIDCGWAVATLYANSSNKPSAILYDTRYNSTAAPVGNDWGATIPTIHPPSWNRGSIGNVFGIAIDPGNRKVYLAATDIYKYDGGYTCSPGPGGTAGVYETDLATLNTNPIVYTTNSAGPPSFGIGTNMLPNTGGFGNGIGNIAFDQVNQQLFLTNLEDGRIYRISLSGDVLSAYDPFGADNGLNGMAPVNERIWGIGISGNRVYFAKEAVIPLPKQIWSVGLQPSGEFMGTSAAGIFTGAEVKEFDVPQGLLEKITDIAFTDAGHRMLLAERGPPHSASVIEYEKSPLWTFLRKYFVGGFSGENSAGGVDYGYREQNNNPFIHCDALVWATGNCLDAAQIPTGGCDIYGIEGISANGNAPYPSNSSTDLFVDFDLNYLNQQKDQIGDVEVFRCGCPGQSTVCDSIHITSTPFNGPQDTCCFKLTMDVQKSNYFTAIQICTNNGVSISNVSVLNGCNLQSYNATQATIVPSGGIGSTFPVMVKDFINFCLSNYQNVPSQQLIIKYFGPNYVEVCQDTIEYACTQKPKCVMLTTEVDCDTNGTYKMDFCVLPNLLIGWNVASVVLNPPAGINFTPSTFSGLNIPPGGIQCNLITNISGPAAVDGAQICFSVTAHAANAQPPINCCTDTVMLVCITLPNCVCDSVMATEVPVSSPNGNCCWKVDLVNNYSNNYFSSIHMDIVTPGVVFGSITNPLTSGWNLTQPLGSQNAVFSKPVGTFIGALDQIPEFCLSGITGTTPVPQKIVLKWLDANKKVVCEDTLYFNCTPPVSTDCAILVCPKIECDSITGVYNFTFQVQNNSGGPIDEIVLNVTSGGILLPSQFIIPPLPNTGISGPLTTQILGMAAGQQLCFWLTVHDLGPNGQQIYCCTHSTPYCFTIPSCGFCPGNLVLNGDFETGLPSGSHESINLAADWMSIWPPQPGASTADFWNTGSENPTSGIGLPTPLPVAAGQFAGFWAHNTTNLTFREGIMNDLLVPILPSTGGYNVHMNIACLDNNIPGASISLYGVPIGAVSTIPGTFALTGNSPLNDNLFSPQAVSLGSYVIPVGCNANFYNISFPFNSAILPSPGIDRIFITRTDLISGKAYVAVDEVCISASDTCCCKDSIVFINDAMNVQVLGSLGDCALLYDIIGLNDCSQITIDWGDGNSTGPLVGDPISYSHTYPATGFYNVCYTIEEVNGGMVCWDYEHCEKVYVLCDTCHCADPSFTDLFLRAGGAPSIPIQCETSYENLGCPSQGNGFTLTGKFECVGGHCPDSNYVNWFLTKPDNSYAYGYTQANPYFGFNIPPSDLSQSGIYTLSLQGFCGGDTCTCEFQFVLDCPNQCPCEPEDLVALSAAVNQGFAQLLYPNSCKACFTPIALSDCENVEWYLNSISGSPIGSSIGQQSFCQTFTAGPGTYTIFMKVTRLKPDGTICETFVKAQTVKISCDEIPGCDNSVFPNPTFADPDPKAGGLNSGGESTGWQALQGDPVVKEGTPGSLDGWSIQLYGNLDTAGVLATTSSICLARDTGMVNLRLYGDPVPGAPDLGHPPRKPCDKLIVQLFQGDGHDIRNCDNCFQLAAISLSDLDSTDWYEVSIPFDLKYWLSSDTCTDLSGVDVRAAAYVTNALGSNQGGAETYSYTQIDNFCLQGTIVGVSNPPHKETLHIYPNPTNGSLTVALPNPAVKGMSMRIVDLTGQLILERKAEVGKTVQGLEVAYLPQGMYFLQMMSYGRTLSVSKFVKQ